MNHPLLDVLHTLAGSLLIPVVMVLLGLTAFAMLNLGGLIGEGIARWQDQVPWRVLLRSLERDPQRRIALDELVRPRGVRAAVIARWSAAPGNGARALDVAQIDVERRLDRLLLGIRLGPVLGLAGTLIPLGPTLLSLTTWDLGGLSTHLVVAFNATIVGLLVGGLCYTVHLIRRQWYRTDLADLEFLASRLLEPGVMTTASTPEPMPCAASA